MEISELRELMTAEGLRLLDSLPPYDSTPDVMRLVTELRRAGASASLSAVALTQAKLRGRAAAKFGPFAERMLFTEAGLEQATRLRVAALHAGRFQAAGIARVADLGSGIGGDAMAIAALDLEVTAVEADEVTAAIAAYNLAPWPNARVVHGDATTADLSEADGVYLDPARRTAGHSGTRRLADPADHSPSLPFAFELADRLPTGIKLGPGMDRGLIPPQVEAQWVSVDREVVELGLWSGALAREGVRRSALVLGEHGRAELTAGADSEDVPVRPLGEFLYEPDGAVIRARLIGDLGRMLDAGTLSQGIAYLTADSRLDTPFATRFRVLETLPLDERALRRELAARGIGALEIKKRGVDVDPAQFRKRLALKGDGSATLVLTRLGGRHVALLAKRE